MKFQSLTLKEDFLVEKLYTVHYFEYMSDFQFDGEAHPFWEFLCVDKGEVNIMADNRPVTLHKNEIIFHKPNEFHNISANGIIAPNLVVITFSCHSPHMSFFENKILTISEIERNLLGSIILEAKNAFSSPLDDPYFNDLERRTSQLPGCEQLIKLRLEELLIQLYRRYTKQFQASPIMKSTRKKMMTKPIITLFSILMHIFMSICPQNRSARITLSAFPSSKSFSGTATAAVS